MKRRLSLLGSLYVIAALLVIPGCARKPRPYGSALAMYEGTAHTPKVTATNPPLILTPIPIATPSLAQIAAPSATQEAVTNTDSYTITFLNVGQADCTIIQKQGSANAVLIDAGNADDGKAILNYLQQQGIRELECVIATHPHEDHIGGLSQVLYNYRPNVLIMPLVEYETAAYERVMKAVEEFQIEVKEPRIGDVYAYENSSIRILAPQAHPYDDINNYSVGIRWEYGNTSLIACGDAEELSEGEMLMNKNVLPYLNADILKVNHHGSASSSTTAFLLAVSPEYAVVPCDEANSDDNLPNKKTLQRLTLCGASVLRTDMDGTVTFITDGVTLKRSA